LGGVVGGGGGGGGGGEATEHKMGVLIFSTFVWKISHSKNKRGRYDQKSILVFM